MSELSIGISVIYSKHKVEDLISRDTKLQLKMIQNAYLNVQNQFLEGMSLIVEEDKITKHLKRMMLIESVKAFRDFRKCVPVGKNIFFKILASEKKTDEFEVTAFLVPEVAE